MIDGLVNTKTRQVHHANDPKQTDFGVKPEWRKTKRAVFAPMAGTDGFPGKDRKVAEMPPEKNEGRICIRPGS